MIPNKKKLLSAVVGSTILASSGAFALEPSPIKAGPVDLIPTIDTDVSHTDNMFRSATNEVSSNLWVISPRLEAVINSGRNTFSLAGEVNEGNFSASKEDDYTDWRVDGNAHLEFNARNTLDLSVGYFDTREMRGSGYSQGGFLPTVPDEYDETTYGATYQYGSGSSFGRLVLGVSSYDKSYSNNRITTRFRDREDLQWDATFYVNISPRTEFLVQYQTKDIDYVNDPVAVVGAGDTLDSTETYGYVGIGWAATAKTQGTLKVGYGIKDFDDPDRRQNEGGSWELGLQYLPLSYSTFNLTARRGFDESTGVGNSQQTTSYGLNWVHEWSNDLSSTIGINHSDNDYTNSLRDDEIRTFGARLDYAVQRWLDVYVAFTAERKDSTFANYAYDSNVMAIGFAASL